MLTWRKLVTGGVLAPPWRPVPSSTRRG